MTEQTKKLSRRDALKVLGAATGASLLASLPSKWSAPEIASGVLPAHAQTSGGLTFLNGGFITSTIPGKFSPNDRSGNIKEISATLGVACGAKGTHWVQISQPIANIPLGLVTSSNFPVTWNIPVSGPPDDTYYTDGNGKVEIPIDLVYSPVDPPDFTWTFINPSDGTDTRTFTISACGVIS